MKKPARKTKTSARKSRKTVQFLQQSNCATCRKARRFMERRGYSLNFRDLIKDRLTAAELEKLIGKRDHQEFLNPRTEQYRKNKVNERPPSRREAIGMMAKHPNLIRRPIVVAGGRVAIGYDENGMIRF